MGILYCTYFSFSSDDVVGKSSPVSIVTPTKERQQRMTRSKTSNLPLTDRHWHKLRALSGQSGCQARLTPVQLG